MTFKWIFDFKIKVGIQSKNGKSKEVSSFREHIEDLTFQKIKESHYVNKIDRTTCIVN